MKNPYMILLGLLFPLVFNGLFFGLYNVSEANASVWLSYGMIHLAYLIIVCLPLLTPKSPTDSFIFGQILYAIATPYFIIELIVGLIFILWNPETITIPLVVQLLLFAGFLAYFLTQASADQKIAISQQERQQAVQPARDMIGKMKMLLTIAKNPELVRTLSKQFDSLYYSSTRQTSNTAPIDQELSDAIDELRAKLRAGDETSEQTKQLVTTIGNLILERKEAAKFS